MNKIIHIVLAGSDPTALRRMQLALIRSGRFHICGIAADGKAVLSLLQSCQPDVLLTDMLLPYLSELSRIREPAPLIVGTAAFLSYPAAEEARRLGVSLVIGKPYCCDAVVEQLLRLVRDPRKGEGQILLLETVTELLRTLDIPANLSGYTYLREAILLTVDDRELIHGVTTYLYPQIASMYGTTPSRVERSIRHAVAIMWQRCDGAVLRSLFGPASAAGRPSNAECIALLSDTIQLTCRKRLYALL